MEENKKYLAILKAIKLEDFGMKGVKWRIVREKVISEKRHLEIKREH